MFYIITVYICAHVITETDKFRISIQWNKADTTDTVSTSFDRLIHVKTPCA